jgi:hypothetical protein
VARTFLTTYLNDHLAGADAALEMLSLLRQPGDSDVWRRIDADVSEDRGELESLLRKTGAAPSTVRRAVGWTGEKLAELKLRLDDPSGGELRRFELIEALAIGIDGKRALWTALQRSAEVAADLGSVDYPRLIARAEEQRRVVEEQRLEAAASALRA